MRTPHPPRPTRRAPRLAAATCAAAAVAALGATAVAPAADASPAPADATAHPSRVTLPTGEHLALTWSGDMPHIGRPAGDRSPLSITTVGNDVYAVPFEAAPYLGAALDRGLFDVTRLAAAEGPDGTGAVPVTLDHTGAVPDVPGVRITASAGTRATGRLDAASAARFGAALRARLRSDPAGARQAGTPVPGLTRLALDGPAAPAAVRPRFPMMTLTVNLTPPAGTTVAGGMVLVTNVDDSRKYSNFVSIGPENYARISVPAGNYDLVGTDFTVAADGSQGPSYVPVAVDYTVTATDQTVTLDAGRATEDVSFTTPKPSALAFGNVDVVTTDGVHPSTGGITYSYLEPGQVLFQSTPTTTHGVLEFDTYEHRTAAPVDGVPVDYHLTAEWLTGIPTSLHRTVAAGQLARVNHRFAADAGVGRYSFASGPVYPDLRGVIDTDAPSTMDSQIDYVYGPSDARWTPAVYRDTATGGDNMFSAPVSYLPGHTYAVDWFGAPLAPGVPGTVTFPRPHCVTCRTDDHLSLSLSDQLDGNANHSGGISAGDTTGYSRFQVFQDGTSIADAPDTDGVTVPVPTAAHTYRISYDLDRAKLGFATATKTSVVYTVNSSSSSGAALPAGWQCTAEGAGACTILPLLTTTVPLPTTQAGTLPTGTTSFVVTVGHVAAATPSAISSLTFATSLDGTTYTTAPVTALGNGRYRVALTTPTSAVGHRVSIRVHAADAAGGTATQTVTDAYTVTGSR